MIFKKRYRTYYKLSKLQSNVVVFYCITVQMHELIIIDFSTVVSFEVFRASVERRYQYFQNGKKNVSETR